MKEELCSLFSDLNLKLENIKRSKELESFKVLALGKKSELSLALKQISTLTDTEKKEIGKLVNTFKEAISSKILEREKTIKEQELLSDIKKSSVDISLPGNIIRKGSLHPISLILDEIIEIFKPLGFSIQLGPEVEHDYYCFEALNIPKDHPARDMQDTFYVFPSVVLRTHTSSVQIRTMLEHKAPLRILAPGKVYRSDYDISHTPMFHQIEGLLVDKGVSFAQLKSVLLYFAQKMFGEHTKIRLRPSFFPFTEPSAEMDVTCVNCKGKGCRICKNTGFLEILGCGMVHPKVFEHTGYENVTGFAFGMGLERIAMLKYNLDDIRILFENDVRFLSQF